MAQDTLVDRFCTPPNIPETDYDRTAFAEAQIVEFSLNGQRLMGYSWGAGRHVLLAHGWGSRASHLAVLGRSLVKAGFHVLALDGPAHGQSLKQGQPNRSSMFEFCRAMAHVASTVQPLYAVVGHSLSAAAAVFTAAGHARLADYRIDAERLVLLSPPANVARMIEVFCRNAGEMERSGELTEGLEHEFDFRVADYVVPAALPHVRASIQIVHDAQDEDVPVADALAMQAARPDVRLTLTQGAGHQRILVNRTMLRAVKDFLLAESLKYL
jgi:pimeloyl-ACP methyl ester carboxylesterase